MIKIDNKQYVLSISYGDYIDGTGGTDKFIRAQAEILRNSGISIIHLYPIRSRRIVKQMLPSIWGVTADGRDAGWYETSQIIRELFKLRQASFEMLSVAIHHFRYTEIRDIDTILDCCGANIVFYLHDLWSVCPARGLVRKNGDFCGCSFQSNEKCSNFDCFKPGTVERSQQIRQLFEKHGERITFIAPSESTKELFLKCFPQCSDKVPVIGHQNPSGVYRKETPDPRAKLRTAYVGAQALLKGWGEWENAAKLLHGSHNYEFFHLGMCRTHHPFIKEIAVDFRKDKAAMIKALRENGIDIAVLWSTVPETYSYTYYEAYAADCFVITGTKSGNIRDQVKQNRNGYVGESESLYDILADEDRVRQLLDAYRSSDRTPPLDLIDSDAFLTLLKTSGDSTIKNVRPNCLPILGCRIYKAVNNLRKTLRKR